MGRLMVLCSLPRSNPGRPASEYQRVNGPLQALILSAGRGQYKLPFGNLPRLLMAWISTEAVQDPEPRVNPWRFFALGVHADSGGLQIDSGSPRGDRHPTAQPDESAFSFQRRVQLI